VSRVLSRGGQADITTSSVCLPITECCGALLVAAPICQLFPAGMFVKPSKTNIDSASTHAALSYCRVDALTMVCCHPRTTTLPTALELEVAAEAVRLTLR